MKTAIFDIDGTLADCSHRLHFVKHGKRDWGAFFGAMEDDTIVEPVRELFRALVLAGNKVICCSGRPEDYRALTERWLSENGVIPDALYMRASGDFRADHIVKAEILRGIIEDGFDPFVVIDDRQSVVDMWRENGLTCLQCAPERLDVPDTALLSLMIGPSGAGKSTWLSSAEARQTYGIYPEHVVSSDVIRRDLCGDFQDQTKNDAVFDAVHAIVKTRLLQGLPTVIDATNLRRRDRLGCVALAPSSVPVRYFVIDRPEAEKRATGGWRNDLKFDLIAKHAQTFGSQAKEILAGDNLPNVTVFDLRKARLPS